MKRTYSTITSILLVVAMFISVLALPTSAAYSALQMNISDRPCSANLSAASLPGAKIPSQGDTYYINLAGTTDYKLSRAEFYIKAPGQSTFSCIYDYNTQGFFRWVNCSYRFTQSGNYTIRIVITATNGSQGTGEISFDVSPTQINSVSDDNGIVINWNANGTTSTSRNAADTFSINGTEVVPGSIHKTYYSNGVQSTSGSAYYCMYNNQLTYVAGAQCMGYVYYLQLLQFGIDSHKTVLYNYENDDGISDFYGVRYNKTLTADEFKALLKYTGAGTHLRAAYNTHSIYVLKVEDDGFYYTDANTSASTYGANNIKIGFTTYSDFASGSYSYLNYVEYYHG